MRISKLPDKTYLGSLSKVLKNPYYEGTEINHIDFLLGYYEGELKKS